MLEYLVAQLGYICRITLFNSQSCKYMIKYEIVCINSFAGINSIHSVHMTYFESLI